MKRLYLGSDVVSIYDAAMRYKKEQTPLAVIAGLALFGASVVTGRQKDNVCLANSGGDC
ncbi:hypothetical protein [Escherichia coli]|uniref:hypothetical protein n=1 Tax=Escherichia coli TaxID=562 RepID=UPI0022282B52|nr:hypothetical protein [Escherichia coli]MCW3371899.1 hypothetical protein [Escherichia coli]